MSVHTVLSFFLYGGGVDYVLRGTPPLAWLALPPILREYFGVKFTEGLVACVDVAEVFLSSAAGVCKFQCVADVVYWWQRHWQDVDCVLECGDAFIGYASSGVG